MNVESLSKLVGYKSTWIYERLKNARSHDAKFGLDEKGNTNLSVYETVAFMRMANVYRETKNLQKAIVQLFYLLGRFNQMKKR